MYRGRLGAEDPVDWVRVDGGLDGAGVDGLYCWLIVSLVHHSISEQVRDGAEVG